MQAEVGEVRGQHISVRESAGGIGEHQRDVRGAEQIVEFVAEERRMTNLERVAVRHVDGRTRERNANAIVVMLR